MDGDFVVRDRFADRVFIDLKIAEILGGLVLRPKNASHIIVEQLDWVC